MAKIIILIFFFSISTFQSQLVYAWGEKKVNTENSDEKVDETLGAFPQEDSQEDRKKDKKTKKRRSLETEAEEIKKEKLIEKTKKIPSAIKEDEEQKKK